MSVVVPIGVIVAIAIVCVVIAVFGSAQRADEVAIETERQLLARALTTHAERVLRSVEGIATSDASMRNIRADFDPNWTKMRVGQRLHALFDQDSIFVVDPSDRFLYARLENVDVDPSALGMPKRDLGPILDLLRGRTLTDGQAVIAAGFDGAPPGARKHRAVRLQMFLDRPAIVAGVVVAARSDKAAYVDAPAPAVLTVQFIDAHMLAEIASQLQLVGLRMFDGQPLPPGDYPFDFTDPGGQTIGRFAWTPKRPGAEIVNRVIPFIAIALAGFALLAALMLRYVRRAAATIAAGETRLRHLAMHDPLCGLPNRIYFSERLEEVINNVRKGGQPAAVFYIDLDHFKDVNDTLGHPVGDELIRSVTQRLTHALRSDDIVARIGGDEFAVITSASPQQAGLQAIAKRPIAGLCAPHGIGGQPHVAGASPRLAIVHQHVSGAADIMRHADMALYRAKNEGRNRACIYDTAMDSDLLKRKLVENDLRMAIENDELSVAYQPIVNNSGETVVGVEAL